MLIISCLDISDEDLEVQEREFEGNSRTKQQDLQKLTKALDDDKRNEVIVQRKLKDVDRERGVLEGEAEVGSWTLPTNTC
jgi:hypothetical protein